MQAPGGTMEHGAIRAIALFEAFKGAIVLLAATGLLSLLHRDVYEIAVRFVEHAHLNPAAKYPQIFLDAAAKMEDSRLLVLALGAAAYSVVRFVEAYGLLFEKAWAEVLAAGSGAIYVPFEVLGIYRHVTWHGVLLLALNVVVVFIMLHALMRRRRGAQKSS